MSTDKLQNGSKVIYCRMIPKFIISIMNLIKSGLWLPVVLPCVLYRLIFSWNIHSKLRAKLQDKVVLITGASSGLGEALAHAFYNAGCHVILAARRVEELERVQRELLSSNATVLSHPPSVLILDLSDLKSIPDKAEDALRIHGRIDILVNNGGISYRGTVLDTKLEVDLKLMVINYFAQITLTKALLPSMVENGGGHIVAVSSIQGKIAIPYRSSYAASKHAMQAFFDTLRAETHHQNIKVTVVIPSYIKTNLSINALTGKGMKYNEMDSTTASGMSPSAVAHRILKSVVQEHKEVVISTWGPQIAIILRTFCPRLYYLIMERRAQKQKLQYN